MKELDIKIFSHDKVLIKIGELTQDVIEILGLERQPCDIMMWGDRYTYIQKHIADFTNKEEFFSCVKKIPGIIEEPDYVAIHPNKKSLEYIKRIDRLTIVAIRLTPNNKLYFRSFYPLTENQLKRYLEYGSAVTIKKS